jgi:hypothetical protein
VVVDVISFLPEFLLGRGRFAGVLSIAASKSHSGIDGVAMQARHGRLVARQPKRLDRPTLLDGPLAPPSEPAFPARGRLRKTCTKIRKS